MAEEADDEYRASVVGWLEPLAETTLQNRPAPYDATSEQHRAKVRAALEATKDPTVDAAFAKHAYEAGEGVAMPYRLFTPKVEEGRKYPLVLLLHGAGGKGSDNERNLTFMPRYMSTSEVQQEHPCFIVAPQSARGWDNPPADAPAGAPSTGELTVGLVDELARKLPIDRDRIYLAGLSMGGWGTTYVMGHWPQPFAAASPMCGAEATNVERYFDKPIWIWHGDVDVTVPVHVSRDYFRALRDAGGEPLYTELHLVGHGVYHHAIIDPRFIDWLFAQRLGE
jgi:predicted peptidase